MRAPVEPPARADCAAELAGLQNIESAVEQAGIFPAIVEFESALRQLGSDPVDPSLRAATVASAETLANKFNIAANSLASVAEGAQFEARAGVDEANVIATAQKNPLPDHIDPVTSSTSASSIPPPRQSPFIAHTVGIGRFAIRS